LKPDLVLGQLVDVDLALGIGVEGQGTVDAQHPLDRCIEQRQVGGVGGFGVREGGHHDGVGVVGLDGTDGSHALLGPDRADDRRAVRVGLHRGRCDDVVLLLLGGLLVLAHLASSSNHAARTGQPLHQWANSERNSNRNLP
jgi:hypothetical protein